MRAEQQQALAFYRLGLDCQPNLLEPVLSGFTFIIINIQFHIREIVTIIAFQE
ncbi:hypothetical protein J6590_084915 [Homalodisca vitripennis]|nr:hypothetical protein J6590_084915 [Homalodisca vitripennis]